MSERGLPPHLDGEAGEEVVYINDNEETFHKSIGCSRGGARCTMAEAVEMGYDPCGTCYRNREIVETDDGTASRHQVWGDD